MFRRKEKVLDCNSFEDATKLLIENDLRGPSCAMQWISGALIQGGIPTDACLAAIIENVLLSEDADLRAVAFHVVKCSYKMRNHIVYWANVRRAMQQEISNAENILAFEGAFELLASLPIWLLVSWFCSNDSAQTMRSSLVLESLELRTISVRHIGALLPRVWCYADSTSCSLDTLLFATQSYEDRSKHDLTSDEPRRIKENLMDLTKDCYKHFVSGCLGKATTSDAQTGNLKVLSDNLSIFSTYCRAILDMVRCYNENRSGLSLNAWISTLINGACTNSDGRDQSYLGLQTAMRARANSAIFVPFMQVILHDLLKDVNILIAKCDMCDEIDAQYPLSMISEMFLALLHEHFCMSCAATPRNQLDGPRYSTLTPVSVQTTTKDVYSFSSLDRHPDDTNSSRTGNSDKNLQHLCGEWIKVHLVGDLWRWRDSAPSVPELRCLNVNEYEFCLATCKSSWHVLHIIVDMLQYDLLQTLRAQLVVELVGHLLELLQTEVAFSITRYGSSDASIRSCAQTGLGHGLSMVLLLMRGLPDSFRLSTQQSTLRCIKLAHEKGHLSGVACCRLLAELCAVTLEQCIDKKNGVEGFLNLECVREAFDATPEGRATSMEQVRSCRFNAYLVAAICRCSDMALKSAQQNFRCLFTTTLFDHNYTSETTQTGVSHSLILSTLANIKHILHAFRSCMHWSTLLPSGESAQLAWVSLVTTAMQILLPSEETESLAQRTCSVPEAHLEGRNLTTVIIGLLDVLLDTVWTSANSANIRDQALQNHSTPSKSKFLSLMSKTILARAKHVLESGAWYSRKVYQSDNGAFETIIEENSSSMGIISSQSWTESQNDLLNEICASSEDLIRILENDVLRTLSSQASSLSGNMHGQRDKSDASLTVQQTEAANSIVEIAKSCLAVNDTSIPNMCLNLLKNTRQAEISSQYADFLRLKAEEVAELITVRSNDNAANGNEATKKLSRGAHFPSLPHIYRDVKELGFFSSNIAQDGNVAQNSLPAAASEVLSIVDDVASSHFSVSPRIPLIAETPESPPGTQLKLKSIYCPHTTDGLLFSQISGSSDPLTVLAAAGINRHTLKGKVRVKVVNSSGFKLDGYCVQALIKSRSMYSCAQDLSKFSQSAHFLKQKAETVLQSGGGMNGLKNSAMGNGQFEFELFDGNDLSAEVAPGAVQQSVATEYVVHNGTSECEFDFELNRLGAIEIVIRLKYFDLQEGVPIPGLWSLVKTVRHPVGQINAGFSSVDDFRFTTEKSYFNNRTSSQCAPVRLGVASQLIPFGNGMFSAFKSSAWINRIQNWCAPEVDAQLSPDGACFRSNNFSSLYGIPVDVFSDLWHRCKHNASPIIPLCATYHGGGVQYETGFSIAKLVNEAVLALERGVGGSLLPGSHYVGFCARTNTMSDTEEYECLAWALNSIWGAEVAIRIHVWFDESKSATQNSVVPTPVVGLSPADPLSAPMSFTGIHYSELGAAVTHSAVVASDAQSRRVLESYHAGIEIRASDMHSLSCLLEDIDALVLALTADVLKVSESEFEDKFNESRALNAKLSAFRNVTAAATLGSQSGAFSVY